VNGERAKKMLGLIFHAEHSSRHAGEIVTLTRIVSMSKTRTFHRCNESGIRTEVIE
jgi:hypothetical protein